MTKNIKSNTPEQNRFTSISDFKWCMYCGGEVEIEYNDRVFGILSKAKRTPESEVQIIFFEKFVEIKRKLKNGVIMQMKFWNA